MALSDKLNPTYYGYIGSTKDALIIIQATLNNHLLAVPRRPHDKERPALIQSGNIFVFIEERSGIKRWTDGIAWSPSRILGRFLVYRELDRAALSDSTPIKDEYSDASTKRKKRKKQDVLSEFDNNNSDHSYNNSNTQLSSYGQPNSATDLQINEANNNLGANGSVTNRALVGSLVASYAFKDRGLIKKTLSVTLTNSEDQQAAQQPQHHGQAARDSYQWGNTETIHLVSYYSADEVINGKLRRPSDSPNLKDIQVSPLLYNALRESSLGSKTPMEDESFYFFDTNNNLVSIPNPTAKSIAAQQQQQQHQQVQQVTASNSSPSTFSATTTTTSSFPQRSSIHDPYHRPQSSVSSIADYSAYTFNPARTPAQQQQQQQPPAQQPYWANQTAAALPVQYYGSQPLQPQAQQYWSQQQAPQQQSQQQQVREGSFSSISSNKKNSPVVDNFSNFSITSQQMLSAQQLQQAQQQAQYNPYHAQYHMNQVPKFVQPQFQQQQYPQIQQVPSYYQQMQQQQQQQQPNLHAGAHHHSYDQQAHHNPSHSASASSSIIGLQLANAQLSQQAQQIPVMNPGMGGASTGSVVDPMSGVALTATEASDDPTSSAAAATGTNTGAAATATAANGANVQQRFFGYEV